MKNVISLVARNPARRRRLGIPSEFAVRKFTVEPHCFIANHGVYNGRDTFVRAYGTTECGIVRRQNGGRRSFVHYAYSRNKASLRRSYFVNTANPNN